MGENDERNEAKEPSREIRRIQVDVPKTCFFNNSLLASKIANVTIERPRPRARRGESQQVNFGISARGFRCREDMSAGLPRRSSAWSQALSEKAVDGRDRFRRAGAA